MVVNWIPCPFRGCDGCNSGGRKGLTKKYFIDHLGSPHFSSDASRLYLKDLVAIDSFLFSSMDIALKRPASGSMGSVSILTPLVRVVNMTTAR